VATLVSMFQNFWCSLEVAAAELNLCFVIRVMCGGTHFSSDALATIVVLHHKHMKLF